MISPKITIILFNKDIQSILQKYKNKIILYSCIQLFHLYIHEKLWFRLLMFCVQEIGNHLSALQQIHIKIRKRQLAQLTTKIFEFVNRCLTSQQIEHQDYSNGAANGRLPFFVWLEFAWIKFSWQSDNRHFFQKIWLKKWHAPVELFLDPSI